MALSTTLYDIAIQTLSKIISNLAWFILIYWGIRTLAKSVPKWLEQYERIKKEQRAIDNALSKKIHL